MESELSEMSSGKTVLPIQEGWNGENPSAEGQDESFLSRKDEADLPPEFCRYRDEGCDLADSCLNCPFSKCIYDEPGGKQRWLKRLRAREMAKLFTAEGKGIKELAVIFGISQRTVQRALKVALDNPTRKGQKNESRL